jgi:hypothetical protein
LPATAAALAVRAAYDHASIGNQTIKCLTSVRCKSGARHSSLFPVVHARTNCRRACCRLPIASSQYLTLKGQEFAYVPLYRPDPWSQILARGHKGCRANCRRSPSTMSVAREGLNDITTLTCAWYTMQQCFQVLSSIIMRCLHFGQIVTCSRGRRVQSTSGNAESAARSDGVSSATRCRVARNIRVIHVGSVIVAAYASSGLCEWPVSRTCPVGRQHWLGCEKEGTGWAVGESCWYTRPFNAAKYPSTHVTGQCRIMAMLAPPCPFPPQGCSIDLYPVQGDLSTQACSVKHPLSALGAYNVAPSSQCIVAVHSHALADIVRTQHTHTALSLCTHRLRVGSVCIPSVHISPQPPSSCCISW